MDPSMSPPPVTSSLAAAVATARPQRSTMTSNNTKKRHLPNGDNNNLTKEEDDSGKENNTIQKGKGLFCKGSGPSKLDGISLCNENNPSKEAKNEKVKTRLTQELVAGEAEQEEEKEGEPSVIPLNALPALAIETIMLYFDDARDVFNLAYCGPNQHLIKCVTPEIVIRAAVFDQGKAWGLVLKIVHMMEIRSIHIPSTLRMLRLVNGTKCERGSQCFRYNAITKESCSLPYHQELASCNILPFGLLICTSCKSMMSCCDGDFSPFRVEDFERIETSCGKSLNYPYVETATGERAGALISAMQLTQLPVARGINKITSQNLLENLFQEIDYDTPGKDSDRARRFITAHEKATGQMQKMMVKLQRLQDLEGNARLDACCLENEEAKRVLSTIESLWGNCDHAELVLDCGEGRNGYIFFKLKLVDDVLGPFIRAGYTKNLVSAVENIRQILDMLDRNGFLTGPHFLSFLSSGSDQITRQLYRGFESKFNEDNVLLQMADSKLRARTFRLLQKGKRFDAFLMLMNHEERSWDESFRRIIKKELVPTITPPSLFFHPMRTKIMSLASGVWDRNVERYDDINTEMKLRVKHEDCRQEFLTLYNSIEDYLSDPQTIELSPNMDPSQRLTRILDLMHRSFMATAFLLTRSHSTLRSVYGRMEEDEDSVSNA